MRKGSDIDTLKAFLMGNSAPYIFPLAIPSSMPFIPTPEFVIKATESLDKLSR